MPCFEQQHDSLDFSNCLPVYKWAIIKLRGQRLRRCQTKKLGRNREVSERPASNRSVEVWISPRLYEALMTRGGRLRLASVAVIIILGVAIGGQIYGRVVAARDVLERDATIQQLQSENQKLEVELYGQNGKLAALQTKFATVQATLEAILPAEDTYNIDPNQAIIVAGGRLTIGLVGSPTNEGINININGKQHSAAAGDVIRVALEPSTNCQVAVQSFDMFKAVLTAWCAGVTPR